MAKKVKKRIRTGNGGPPQAQESAVAADSPAAWIPDKLASVTSIDRRRHQEPDGAGAADGSPGEWLPDGVQPRTNGREQPARREPAEGKPVEPNPEERKLAEWKPVDPEPAEEIPQPAPFDQGFGANEAALAADGAETRSMASTLESAVNETKDRLRHTEELLQSAELRAREAEERGERLASGLDALKSKLSSRVAEAEAELEQLKAKQAKSAALEERSKPKTAPPKLRFPPKPVKPRPPKGERLDLNGINFEALRELGLSVTQSARLIAQRDQRNGFRSIDDLNNAWGLPREIIELLKERTYV